MAERPFGGDRPPQYLYEMALMRIEDLMRQAMEWPKILATLSTEGYTDSGSTAKSWRREVMRRWAAEEAELRPARKDLWRARLESIYNGLLQRIEAAQGYTQAALYSELIKLSKLAIQLDGAQAPIVVRHEGRVDVAAMTPQEREREIETLIAKRKAAIEAAPQTRNN